MSGRFGGAKGRFRHCRGGGDPVQGHRGVAFDQLPRRDPLLRVVPARNPVAHSEDAECQHLRIEIGAKLAGGLSFTDQLDPKRAVSLPDRPHLVHETLVFLEIGILQRDAGLRMGALEAHEMVFNGELDLAARRHVLL